MIAGLTLAGALIALAVFELATGPSSQAPPAPQQAPPKEFHQDFRDGRLLHSALQLVGPEADQVSRFEAEGLRITLPANRPEHYPVEVVTTFALGGDFEITAAYELLSATQPADGYGVGVALNVADNKQRTKFAKIARVLLVKAGSVFQAESWNNHVKNGYRARTKPTESRLGRLRLVRKGPSLRYLAAEGTAGDFQEVSAQDDFGTDDLAHIHLVVADSGSPGNAVDARLVDFTIRAASLNPDPTQPVAPAAEPPAEPAPGPRSRTWLTAAAVLGLLFLSALVLCLVVFWSRRKALAAAVAADSSARAAAAGPTFSVHCPGCGKTFKVKRKWAGKKVRCSCGKGMVVAGPETDSSVHPA
jgi:hypothetical protein